MQRGRHDHEFQFFLACDGREIGFDAAEQVAERNGGKPRFHRPGVETGNVENGAEDGFDRFQRRIDVAHQRAVVRMAHALHQRRRIEAGGIERLQDVVAGSGEEAGLADIRLVGAGAGFGQFMVDPGQFAGAFGNALLQRFVRLFQRLVGGDALGDVGEGGDDALVRHGVGTHLDDRLAAVQHQRKRFVEGLEVAHHMGLVAHRNVAALGEDGNDVGQRETHLADMFRQVEQAAETPVPDAQPVGTVEDGDALVHLGQRRLQHVLVVLQRFAGLVEQPGGIGGGVFGLL